MAQIWINNASGTLAQELTAGSTTLTLDAVGNFTDPGTDYYEITLTQPSGETSWEIAQVTGVTGSTLTISSGISNTWTVGTVVQARLTAQSLGTLAGQGELAGTAVQPEDLAPVATTGAYADLTGAPTITGDYGIEVDATLNSGTDATVQIGLASNVSKVDEAEEFTGHKTFTSYTETGAILAISSGVLDIPLDGKTYGVNVTEEITSITLSSVPIAPLCRSTVVYFRQDATGHAVVIPLTWNWADSVVTEVDQTANAKTRMLISTDPFGDIHADAEQRGAS